MAEITNDMAKQQVVGSVIADDVSPSFDVFRFKANANEYVYPGSLIGTDVGEGRFLIGRVSASIEVNPHESALRAKVREAMEIEADYPEEELSTNIYRVYEADIIEEGFVEGKKLEISEPTDMAKAGSDVFLPTEVVIAQAMGFETDPEKSLCLGRTRIAMDAESATGDKQEIHDNVLLKPQFIQRHLFVGGTTGSGKSYATGILLEEISKFKIPIVILDSQNEYTLLAEELGGRVLKPGEDYTVRLSSLTESEVLELVPTLKGTLGQELLAYTFIRLKRRLLAREEKTKVQLSFSSLDAKHQSGFGLTELLNEMREDAPGLEIKPVSQKLAIQRTQTSLGRHKFLGEETNWVELLEKHPVVNVDCGELDQSQLQLVVGATLRELQTLRKKKRIPPHVIVLDEAHLLVPEGHDSPCKQVIRENVRIGRHRGICMILITQSPVDIDKKTIRQCNTRFIFALEPDQLDSLRGVKADATDDMLKRLPKMPRGSCILSGTYETIKHAIPIRIRTERKTTHGGQAPDILNEVNEWRKKNSK
jgi:DNA helicase HerA-like ATPase